MGRHASDEGEQWFDVAPAIGLGPPAAPQPLADEPASDGALAGRTLVADSLRYVRAGRLILDGVGVTALPGEVLGVIGPSGSGKSSLLALLAGLERPDGGSVAADGVPVAGVLPQTGLILQAYGLAGVLSAAENVEVVLQAARRVPRDAVRRVAADALAAVGLTPVADHLVEELSGGQQQRVAIARALVGEPRVLLADELTAELDHDTKQLVLGLVLGLAARGATVVIATHDPDVAGLCRRVVRLVDGRLVDL